MRKIDCNVICKWIKERIVRKNEKDEKLMDENDLEVLGNDVKKIVIVLEFKDNSSFEIC